MTEDLRHRYAEALKALRLNLGPNAVTLAVEGHPIGLSGNERDEAARLIEAVRDEELEQLRLTAKVNYGLYRSAHEEAETAEAAIALTRQRLDALIAAGFGATTGTLRELRAVLDSQESDT